jgi:hypothetical protein
VINADYKLKGVYPTKNLEEGGESMCTPSVLRSVVRLLDANMLIAPPATSDSGMRVSQKVIERILTCAWDLRSRSDDTEGLHLWVTQEQFCDYAEETEEGVLSELELAKGWDSMVLF